MGGRFFMKGKVGHGWANFSMIWFGTYRVFCRYSLRGGLIFPFPVSFA